MLVLASWCIPFFFSVWDFVFIVNTQKLHIDLLWVAGFSLSVPSAWWEFLYGKSWLLVLGMFVIACVIVVVVPLAYYHFEDYLSSLSPFRYLHLYFKFFVLFLEV